jgi:hypothetical protein
MDAPSPALLALKRRVSTALLGKVAGVSGVGLPAEGVTIYLEADDAAVRAAVSKALEPLRLKVGLHFAVTGKFARQASAKR